MKLEHAARLRCAACCSGHLEVHPFELSGEERCSSGVLVCERCGAWYPISDRVVDMLPSGHAEAGAREDFYETHRVRMGEFGLGLPTATTMADSDFAAQDEQREHFDSLARRRDRFSYRAFGRQPFQRALRSIQFEAWATLIRPGAVVLDIGCADGLSTFDIARFDVEVIGLDISGEQIRQANERAAREGHDNVTFLIGDANSLPVVDRAGDYVLCFGALHHVPAPERTLREAERVLKHGGWYLGVENNRTPLRPIFDAMMRLRPIWLEEAGANAQIGVGELDRWTTGSGLTLNARATVFVPPQLCNLLGYRASRVLLRITDWIFRRLPALRRWGGLISISGRTQEFDRASTRGPRGSVITTS